MWHDLIITGASSQLQSLPIRIKGLFELMETCAVVGNLIYAGVKQNGAWEFPEHVTQKVFVMPGSIC